jgi:putative toxin-antitoxin system antitoxin component (TIGR02293 family)
MEGDDIARGTARILGMPAATRARIRTFGDLRGEVAKGLRFTVVRHLSDFVTASGKFYSAKLVAQRIGPTATLTRRKAAGRLTPDESERAARLARVMATAVHVLGSDDDARSYMTGQSRDFAGQKPIDVAADELGAREVENVLWQIYYGMSA